jgi:hypothetical protein
LFITLLEWRLASDRAGRWLLRLCLGDVDLLLAEAAFLVAVRLLDEPLRTDGRPPVEEDPRTEGRLLADDALFVPPRLDDRPFTSPSTW